MRWWMSCKQQAAALMLALAGAAHAAAYPARDLTLVNPYPAAGPADIVGTSATSRTLRMMQGMAPAALTDVLAWGLAQQLGAVLGRPVSVERRARIRSLEGHRHVAQSAPDGHTLLITGDTAFLAHQEIAREIGFDPARDLAPVAMIARVPIVLVTSRALGASGVSDLIAIAKRSTKTLYMGSAGGVSTTHLAVELLMQRTGTPIVRVAFNGGMAAMDNVLSGQILTAFVPLPAALPYLGSERVRVIAIGERRRDAVFPEIPALAETIPEFEAGHWYGIFAPAGTPAAVVSRLSAKLSAGVLPPAVEEVLVQRGLRAAYRATDAFAAMLAGEQRKWNALAARRAVNPGT